MRPYVPRNLELWGTALSPPLSAGLLWLPARPFCVPGQTSTGGGQSGGAAAAVQYAATAAPDDSYPHELYPPCDSYASGERGIRQRGVAGWLGWW